MENKLNKIEVNLSKYAISELKLKIKKLSSDQVLLKQQRRNDDGDINKMSKSQAASIHANNRRELRILYAIYGLSRGKTLSQIENKYNDDNSPLLKDGYLYNLLRYTLSKYSSCKEPLENMQNVVV